MKVGNLSDLWLFMNEAHETEFGQEFAPTLRQVVEFLRSEKPLPRDARQWLADLLDPEATNTPKRLAIVARKRGPNPQKKRERNRRIYERLDELVRGPGYPANIGPTKLEAAIAQVAEEWSWIDAKDPTKIRKPSRASLMKIWAEQRADQEAADQARYDEE